MNGTSTIKRAKLIYSYFFSNLFQDSGCISNIFRNPKLQAFFRRFFSSPAVSTCSRTPTPERKMVNCSATSDFFGWGWSTDWVDLETEHPQQVSTLLELKVLLSVPASIFHVSHREKVWLNSPPSRLFWEDSPETFSNKTILSHSVWSKWKMSTSSTGIRAYPLAPLIISMSRILPSNQVVSVFQIFPHLISIMIRIRWT